MPSFRRRASVIDADRVDEPTQDPDRSTDAADALALAEEAEAEAAEADAIAAAARARARAIRLRRQAKAAGGDASGEVEATAAEVEAQATDVDTDAGEATDVETAADMVAEPVEDTEADEADEAGSDTEDGDVDVAEEPSKDQPVRQRRRWQLGRVLKVLAAALAVACTCALITLSVLMVINHRHQTAEQSRRAEFAAAGRQSVVTLMSLDFNTAKDDVQRIIDNSTGQFRDDFKNQADDFIKVAQDSKVITEVTANSVGVESMTNDKAVVLVSATSRVTNAAGAKQEPRSWRLSVDLQRDGGQIKMSKVEFVP
ncbi:MAG: Mce-associated rane protein [Mycobacterium sp.]|nr:Mce-associated rane protein [Mycobacterium sp.]MDT5285081.1 Mce-associated rane protein [Mycobacterium sp.]